MNHPPLLAASPALPALPGLLPYCPCCGSGGRWENDGRGRPRTPTGAVQRCHPGGPGGPGCRGRVASPAHARVGIRVGGQDRAKSVQFLGVVRPLAPAAIALQKTVEPAVACLSGGIVTWMSVSFSCAAAALPCSKHGERHASSGRDGWIGGNKENKKQERNTQTRPNNKTPRGRITLRPFPGENRPLHAARTAAKQPQAALNKPSSSQPFLVRPRRRTFKARHGSR